MTKEKGSQYERRYHLQRALKPLLHIDSHKRRIDMPEGLELGKTDQKRVDALVNDYGYVIQTVLPMTHQEKLLINHGKGLRGTGILFRPDDLFGLKPGSLVEQIGKGKENAANWVDKFRMPATYVGSIVLDEEQLYAFQVHPELIEDKSMNYYMLYKATGKELCRHISKKGHEMVYVHFYKPEFKLPGGKAPKAKKYKQSKLNLK